MSSWFPRGGPAADDHARRRIAMVAGQIEARGLRDPAVLAAMRLVPRHRFLPAESADRAYDDGPVALGLGQTISQPYIVALMTELVRPSRSMKVLEIGTGSGYQTAVLAECVGQVYSIEILPELSRRAGELLDALGYRNIRLRSGDGYHGWLEEAPFDAILLAAAPPERIPPPLLAQLAPGGRLVAPIGAADQSLVRITRTPDGALEETITGVRFVPMTGKAREPEGPVEPPASGDL